MPRVLMVSAHFPPDTGAATHRVRLMAPHLPKYGWDPTVVSVDPRDYEGRLDPELVRLVPDDLRVIRARAWSAGWTRWLGAGDLGARALCGLWGTCRRLLEAERYEALFITMYPTYPALLGPLLKRRFGIPFILDYQDPWVGAWGDTVGGGPNGALDLKSRLTRALATRLEPRVARAADALTAVSRQTLEDILARNPQLRSTPREEIPLGGEAADFLYLRAHPRWNPYFDPADGSVHLGYVGTLLPLGVETLTAVLKAVRLLRVRRPDLYARLHLHFVGTSNQTSPEAPQRVLPVARELGIDDCVREVATRIDYLDALTVQTQATALLMMGSSERHYTASKLYPGLLARRPILAVYHEASSVVDILRRVARAPSARLVTYGDRDRAGSRVEAIYHELAALVEHPVYDPADVVPTALEACSASALAGKLAAVFDLVRRSP
jgi:glycosyltransferase involved in cell wall biosynthesis